MLLLQMENASSKNILTTFDGWKTHTVWAIQNWRQLSFCAFIFWHQMKKAMRIKSNSKKNWKIGRG